MRWYTDIDDFAQGTCKLADRHKNDKMMPVLLEVDDLVAPFGLCTERNINGVKCLVFSGTTFSMKNISKEKQKEQIKANK